jgi:PIN domain nuclease of toxin-antitoxin system
MASATPGMPVMFDASAVLALLFAEPGAEVARQHLRVGVLGAANLAEEAERAWPSWAWRWCR